MLVFIFVIIQLALACLLFYLLLAFVTGAPFVPSSAGASRAMVHLAQIHPGMKVYDLGSGDGRLLFLAAQKGATAVGFEINPFLVLFTKVKIFFSPYRSSIRVYWKNFWTADISGADVVFVYLLPWRMARLKQLLQQKLRPGVLIVSNSFIFSGWKMVSHDPDTHVYVFRI